jgi:hypothetical protein
MVLRELGWIWRSVIPCMSRLGRPQVTSRIHIIVCRQPIGAAVRRISDLVFPNGKNLEAVLQGCQLGIY